MKKFFGFFILFIFMCVAGFIIAYVLFQKKPVAPAPIVSIAPTQSITTAPTFSLEPAPKQSLQGTVTTISGDVMWTSRTATEPAQLTQETLVKQGESILTDKNGKAVVSLGQELIITMNPNSKVQFVQTVPPNIVLQQDAGAVSFAEASGSSVSVRAFGLTTQVTDGKILITMNADRATAVINIQKGSATFAYNDLDYQSHVVTYETGSTLVYDSDKRDLTEE